MKAAFALLFDHRVHNTVKKLAVEMHQKYRIGFAGSQLPPHVSLKQPFLISDLPAIEAFFDHFAASIDPVDITFPSVGGPGDAPVLWLEVEENEILRNLHLRLNRELAEWFPNANTQAPYDGADYMFHLTVALGPPAPFDDELVSLYRSIASALGKREFVLRTTSRYLGLFYYDEDKIVPGSFITYKILPLGEQVEPSAGTG